MVKSGRGTSPVSSVKGIWMDKRDGWMELGWMVCCRSYLSKK